MLNNKIDKMLKEYQDIKTAIKRLEAQESSIKKTIFETYYNAADEEHRIHGAKLQALLSVYFTPYAAAGSVDYLKEHKPELVKDKENKKITISAA